MEGDAGAPITLDEMGKLEEFYDVIKPDMSVEAQLVVAAQGVGDIDQDGDLVTSIVNGRDCESGRPRAVAVRSSDIFEPIRRFFDKILRIADMLMAKLPAEISADIRRSGVYFAGGGARFLGLEQYFHYNAGIRANICEYPELATVCGAGIVCGNGKLLSSLNLKGSSRI